MPTEITGLANGYTYRSEVAKASSLPGRSAEPESTAGSGSETPSINSESLNRLESLPQIMQRSLEFRVDDDTGKQVIRVIDSDTGKLVRQIPPEEVLNVISRAQDMLDDMMKGVLLDDKV
jgi:flagellar protein FlaG